MSQDPPVISCNILSELDIFNWKIAVQGLNNSYFVYNLLAKMAAPNQALDVNSGYYMKYRTVHDKEAL